MDRSVVRRNLAALRERRMWTQVRLAEEAGISPTTVSGIENGRISRPHFGTLRKLAGALGVEPDELLSPSGRSSLSDELDEEKVRLRRLYEEARGSEQRRLIKGMIRQVAANSGSVEASISVHKDKHLVGESQEHHSPQDEHPDTPEPAA